MLGSRLRGIPGEPEKEVQQGTRNHVSTVITGAPSSRDNGFDPFLVVGHVDVDSRRTFAAFQTPAYYTHQDPDAINVAWQRPSRVSLRERKARVPQGEGPGWGWGVLSVRSDQRVLQNRTWTPSCAAAREPLQGELIGVLEPMEFEIHRDLRKKCISCF